MKVIGVGNALVDVLINIPGDGFIHSLNLPKGGMVLVDSQLIHKIHGLFDEEKKKYIQGGSAANTIHGLSNLGVETAFVGKIGRDVPGQFFVKGLTDSNIKPLVIYGNSVSGQAVTLITPDFERTFAVHLGAAVELTHEDIDPGLFSGFDMLHVEGYLVQNYSLIEKVLQTAAGCSLKVSLDLASYNVVEVHKEFFLYLLEKYVDIVFSNEEEALALTGFQPEEAVERLAEMCEVAIVKTGSTGSLIKKGSEKVAAGIFDASPVDTTGAGDLYASGFLYGLIHNYNLSDCARFGALCAARVIEVTGTKMEEERWTEIRNTMKEMGESL